MAINIIFYFCFFDLTINMFTIEQPKQKKIVFLLKDIQFFQGSLLMNYKVELFYYLIF